MLNQIVQTIDESYHERLCKWAKMPTIRNILYDMNKSNLLDISEKDIEQADEELYVKVKKLMHVRLSSHEKFFIGQLNSCKPGFIEHSCLTQQLGQIQTALDLCKL